MPTAPPQIGTGRRQFLVTVQGLVGNWSMTTGGAKSVTVSRVYDGGNAIPYLLTSPPTVSDLVVSRMFLVGRDDTILTNLLPQVGSWWTTVSQQPTDPNYKPGGNLETWVALLTAVQGPEADNNTDAAAMFNLTFTPASAA